jgi:hypothetical protein
MVNENIKLLAENKKPVETVYELKNEYPTYEEFVKVYKSEEGVVDNYELEVDSYGDIRIKGTYYGPGFWSEFGGPVSKTLISMGASALIVGTGGAAAPIVLGGVALTAGGKVVKEVGKEIDCGVLE